MKRKLIGLFLLLFSSTIGTSLWAELPKQPLGWVSDFAGVLDPGTRDQLDQVISAVENSTTAELAVVTVPSLDGLSVEDYALQLFKLWGIGKLGEDNGILFLVAPTEELVRIEVGYGLEGLVPDGLAGRVLDQAVLPAFKAGDVRQGVVQGTLALAAILNEKVQPIHLAPIPSFERHFARAWDKRRLDLAGYGLLFLLGLISLAAGGRRLDRWILIPNGILYLIVACIWWASSTPSLVFPWWLLLFAGILALGFGFWQAVWLSGALLVLVEIERVLLQLALSRGGGSGGGSGFGGFSGGASGGGGASRSW